MNSLKLREMLSNLGRRIDQFDNDYATRVRDVVMPSNPDGTPMSVARGAVGFGIGHPLFKGPSDVLDRDTGRPRPPEIWQETVGSYLPLATSAAARYVAPAAGVTAAGMGLMEIAQALGSTDPEELGY